MKGWVGLLSMVLGIVGVSSGAGGVSEQGQTDVQIMTLLAVFLLVGGLLILAKSDRSSFTGTWH